MTTHEVAVLTGLSKNTVIRRCDAWAEGDRSPYAIKNGRTGGDRGDRQIDALDAYRVLGQKLGELPDTLTAEQWAAMTPGERASLGPSPG